MVSRREFLKLSVLWVATTLPLLVSGCGGGGEGGGEDDGGGGY